MMVLCKLKDLVLVGSGFVFFGLLVLNLFVMFGIIVVYGYVYVINNDFVLGIYVLFVVFCGVVFYIVVLVV